MNSLTLVYFGLVVAFVAAGPIESEVEASSVESQSGSSEGLDTDFEKCLNEALPAIIKCFASLEQISGATGVSSPDVPVECLVKVVIQFITCLTS